MDRCRPGFLFFLSTLLLIVLAGCAGKSSNVPGNDTVQSVTLSPTGNFSLELGSSGMAFSGIARNGIGQVVPIQVSFVSSNNAAVTVANSGQVCAGTWDSLTNPTVCHPGSVGVAQVTATVGGITSAPATVYVHQHIDSITVSPTTPPPGDCFSLNDPNPQFRTATYQATVYSNGVDITSTVGPISFTTTLPNVLTVDNNNQLPMNEVQVTARNPGITGIVASVGGATSNPLPFTTCLVSSVLLQVQNSQSGTINFTNGGSATLEATVFDTRGNNVSNPPLTWGSTNPEIAKFAAATTTNGKNTVTAGNNLGGANVFATCEPPSCNIGVVPALPVYSTGGLLLNGRPDPNGFPAFGTIAVNVTNSKIPTYTAWTTTTGCNNALNCSSVMFSVTTSNTNPIGAVVTLPFTPNSLQITPDGGTAFVGSDQGLMIVSSLGANPSVSTASSQTTPCNVTLCGHVLAISPDSKRVVIGDTNSNPNQVYIFSGGNNAPTDLTITGATAAKFSPDGLKLFILTNTGTMYVYSTVDALVPVGVSGTPTDLAFSPDGVFSYVAGTPTGATSAYTTCSDQFITTSPSMGNLIQIFALPDVQEVPAVKTVNGKIIPYSTITQTLLSFAPPNIQQFTTQFTRDPMSDGQFTCNSPQFNFFNAGPTYNLGQGNFTPLYASLAGAGAQVIVAAQNVPAVLVFDVNSGTTTPFPLINNPAPAAAAASTDGSQMFVASCDAIHPQSQYTCGSVHIVNQANGGDIQQTAYTNPNNHDSMCIGLGQDQPPCLPDLIAVQPQK